MWRNRYSYLSVVGGLVSSARQSVTTNYQRKQSIRQSNSNAAPRRSASSKAYNNDKSNHYQDRARSNDPDPDEDDLDIDMKGWETIPISERQHQRYFTRRQRSQTLSPRKQDPLPIKPPPTVTKTQERQCYSSTANNASPSTSITPTRQPYTAPKSPYHNQVKVAAGATLFKSCDERNDVDYNAMRDPKHEIHWGCDVAMSSIENVYARQERAKSWAKRREVGG
jgi:hypothetical protein